ncbi:MAG: RNA-binding S4 domain-containing protein [Oscillospiraceae bacterium]|nr:RNA-binding S4 domain-containing protein [Oscillospiraceae bacterium]
MRTIKIYSEYIKLDSALKLAGLCETGGEAKLHVSSGEVSVNGIVALERGKKLRPGDSVAFGGSAFTIAGASN